MIRLDEVADEALEAEQTFKKAMTVFALVRSMNEDDPERIDALDLARSLFSEVAGGMALCFMYCRLERDAQRERALEREIQARGQA